MMFFQVQSFILDDELEHGKTVPCDSLMSLCPSVDPIPTSSHHSFPYIKERISRGLCCSQTHRKHIWVHF